MSQEPERLLQAFACHLSEKSLFHQTIGLFLPLALSLLASSSVGIVDMHIASFLGSRAQAAVGLGDQLIFFFVLFGSGLGTAASSFVSRFFGAGNYKELFTYANTALITALLIGILSTFWAFLLGRQAFQILTPETALRNLALPYTLLTSIANTPFVLSICFSAIFRSLGMSKPVLYIWLINASVSNLLSLLLFHLNFHHINVLALGWNLGSFSACFYALAIYRKTIFLYLNAETKETQEEQKVIHPIEKVSHEQDPEKAQDQARNYRSYLEAARNLFHLGVPAVMSESFALAFQFFIYTLFSGMESPENLQAAWTIKMKLEELIALLPILAISSSTAVIVGHNLGAGARSRAISACKNIGFYSAAIMFLVGLTISLLSKHFASAFSFDKQTVTAISELLVPSIFLLPVQAIIAICCAGLEGAGLVRIPMCLYFVFLVLLRAPLTLNSLSASSPLILMGLSNLLCHMLLLLALISYLYWLRLRQRSALGS